MREKDANRSRNNAKQKTFGADIKYPLAGTQFRNNVTF